MRNILIYSVIGIITACIYFYIGTGFSLTPRWSLDYFNLLAESIRHGRLDIQNSGTTYDLSFYNGKWYAPWGALPALFLLPLQLIKSGFVPVIYLQSAIAGCNALFMLYLIQRVLREYFHSRSILGIVGFWIFAVFGTVHFYVGTVSSVWHVEQFVTSLLEVLGYICILRTKRTGRDYLLSSFFFALALLGRPTISLHMAVPIYLYIVDGMSKANYQRRLKDFFQHMVIYFVLPGLLCLSIFFWYNLARFNNPFEYGYSYIHEAPYLEHIRQSNGAMSLANLRHNIWYLLFEIPRVRFENGIKIDINLIGNSIFFFSPLFFAIFLAPLGTHSAKRFRPNHTVIALWIGILLPMIPNLLHYSTGWMQLGYRYSLDVFVPMVLLSMFGMGGKIHVLGMMAIIASVVAYTIGIISLL